MCCACMRGEASQPLPGIFILNPSEQIFQTCVCWRSCFDGLRMRITDCLMKHNRDSLVHRDVLR